MLDHVKRFMRRASWNRRAWAEFNAVVTEREELRALNPSRSSYGTDADVHRRLVYLEGRLALLEAWLGLPYTK